MPHPLYSCVRKIDLSLLIETSRVFFLPSLWGTSNGNFLLQSSLIGQERPQKTYQGGLKNLKRYESRIESARQVTDVQEGTARSIRGAKKFQ